MVPESLQKISHSIICSNTGGHLAFSCDVSKEDNIQSTFREMEKSLGPINYLVNAAGVNRLVSDLNSKLLCEIYLKLKSADKESKYC